MENTGRSVKKAAQRLRSGKGAPDFWALVRTLENANTAKPRLGKGKSPQEENIRFGQLPYLKFPPTDIAEIIEGGRTAGVDATIILYFFGLLGVNGPMPLEFTNYVFRRSHSHFDNTWRRFLDIIHHRFLTFYYRAYAANQQAMSFDRSDDDPLSFIIKSLAGISDRRMSRSKDRKTDVAGDSKVKSSKDRRAASSSRAENQQGRQEQLFLKSAQQFSFLAKTHRGLENMLRCLLKFNIEVRDFIPSSYDIPPVNYAFLGKKNNSLGLNSQIGRTYTSITGKFEIRIGPVSFDEFRSFISGRAGAQLLIEAVALYLDRPLDYSLLFTVRWDTIPLAQLGFDLEHARWDAVQLGYTCWIGNQDEQFTTLSIDAARFKRGRKVM